MSAAQNKGHQILAPSAAHRWVHCAASVPLEAQCPPAEPGADELEGNAAHDMAAELLRQEQLAINFPTGVPRWRPQPNDVAENGVIITEEMIEAVDLFVSEVLGRLGDGLEALHIEEYQAIPQVHADNGGTPDAWWATINPGISAYLDLWDFKHGHRFVDAFENWQEIDYALGIIGRPEFAGIDPANIEITFGIVQPRNYHAMGPVRTWKIRADKLAAYADRLRTAALNARSNDPIAKVGEWCLDCKARAGCRTLQAAADRALDFTSSAVMQNLTPEALGTELTIAEGLLKILETRVAGLRAQGEAVLKTPGGFVPGFEMQRDSARERWTATADEVFACGDILGVDLRKPLAPITPKQAQAVIKKAGFDPATVAGFSERPAGALKLHKSDNTQARRIFGNG